MKTSDMAILALYGGVYLLIFAAGELAGRFLIRSPEISRKAVHCAGGFVAMSFPRFIGSHWVLLPLAAGFAFFLLVSQRRGILASVNGVGRKGWGTLLFPLAVYLLFLLAGRHYLFYFISLLVLTLSDTSAALVGGRYGTVHFGFGESKKSLEGSLAFFFMTFICVYVPLLLWTQTGRIDLVFISFIVAFIVSGFEALSPNGTDNLTVPLGTYCLLRGMVSPPLAANPQQAALFILMTGGAVLLLLRPAYSGEGRLCCPIRRYSYAREVQIMQGESKEKRLVSRRDTGSYGGRMAVYFREMYPVAPRLLSALLIFAGFASLLRSLTGLEPSLFTISSLIGIASLFLLFLILRLMDEIKDLDVDQRLFPERPVPSGRVLVHDIKTSLGIAVLLYIAINIMAGRVFYFALAVLAYAFLMFRFFFMPGILRKYLLLNLATHTPFFSILFAYLIILSLGGYNDSLIGAEGCNMALLVVMFWMPFVAWEVARKIRVASEENEYATYSQIFGFRGAVLIAAGLQTISFVIGLIFFITVPLSTPFILILSAGYVLNLLAYLRFLMSPCPATSRLRPFAEIYILAVAASAVLGGPFRLL